MHEATVCVASCCRRSRIDHLKAAPGLHVWEIVANRPLLLYPHNSKAAGGTHTLLSSLFCHFFRLWYLVFGVFGREGEDRTGALLADREAVLYECSAKEAEFAKKEALLEEDKARASAESQQKVRTCVFCVFSV